MNGRENYNKTRDWRGTWNVSLSLELEILKRWTLADIDANNIRSEKVKNESCGNQEMLEMS